MLSCEEVFGPVTSLYRFDTLDEAIERANAVEFGLSASIFTNSLQATQAFVKRAEAGIAPRELADRGRRRPRSVRRDQGAQASGPHEQGRAAIEFYTEVVTVYQDVATDERFLITGALGCIGASVRARNSCARTCP